MNLKKMILPLIFIAVAGQRVAAENPNSFVEPKTTEEANIIRRVSTAAEGIRALLNAVPMYRQDFGEEPGSVSEIVELGYIELPKPTTLWWWFEFGVYEGTIVSIYAVGLNANEGLSGDTLIYHITTGEFSGNLVSKILPEIIARVIESPVYFQYQQGAKASDAKATIGPIPLPAPKP